uniref:Uncharacterized protein n=1 Tax=Cacopsylla melanoneura TaxID=428564 RepID=A0A8D8MGL4_9HEMI
MKTGGFPTPPPDRGSSAQAVACPNGPRTVRSLTLSTPPAPVQWMNPMCLPSNPTITPPTARLPSRWVSIRTHSQGGVLTRVLLVVAVTRTALTYRSYPLYKVPKNPTTPTPSPPTPPQALVYTIYPHQPPPTLATQGTCPTLTGLPFTLWRRAPPPPLPDPPALLLTSLLRLLIPPPAYPCTRSRSGSTRTPWSSQSPPPPTHPLPPLPPRPCGSWNTTPLRLTPVIMPTPTPPTHPTLPLLYILPIVMNLLSVILPIQNPPRGLSFPPTPPMYIRPPPVNQPPPVITPPSTIPTPLPPPLSTLPMQGLRVGQGTWHRTIVILVR